jgi:hypothetical protein
MTIQELHRAVRLELDKTDANSLPDFTRSEIDYWLNTAQERLQTNKYTGLNLLQKGSEELQKRIDDLRTFIKNSAPIDPVQVTNSKYLLDLSTISDYKGLYKVLALSTQDGCTIEVYPEFCRHDEYVRIKRDPFNRPEFRRPIYLITDNKLEIETKNALIFDVVVTYIKKPRLMSFDNNITSEFPEAVHVELVKFTKDLLLENIESQRIQSEQLRSQTIE